MRMSPTFRASAFAAMLMAAPTLASAQHTLSGHLVEQLPGGGALANPAVRLLQVTSSGAANIVRTALTCAPGVAAECIEADGRFSMTGLPNGLYLLNVTTSRHVSKLTNVTLNGTTDVGVIALIRRPFSPVLTLGPIPAAGGSIPLSVHVQTTWDVPTVPIQARMSLLQDTPNGFSPFVDVPGTITFLWPAGMTDSGAVPLAPIHVPAVAPLGALTCVRLRIFLAGQPDFVLGDHTACQGKRP